MITIDKIVYTDDKVRCYGPEDYDTITLAELDKNCMDVSIQAFCSCHSLEKVVLPEGLYYVQREAFLDCYNLKEINLGDTAVTELQSRTFENCESLETLTLPRMLKKIGECNFSNTKIKKLTIPKGVNAINRDLLTGSNVETLILPDNLIQVEDFVSKCKSLKIIVTGKQKDYILESLRKMIKDRNITLQETDLDTLIEGKKSFKEINERYKELKKKNEPNGWTHQTV